MIVNYPLERIPNEINQFLTSGFLGLGLYYVMVKLDTRELFYPTLVFHATLIGNSYYHDASSTAPCLGLATGFYLGKVLEEIINEKEKKS